jgi:hypothetical protein
MTRTEAIQAMEGGQKVQHRYFSDDEWMLSNGYGMYEFEDGAMCSPVEFWMDRKHDDWNDGWIIFNPAN